MNFMQLNYFCILITDKESDLYMFSLNMDVMLMSNKPLAPIEKEMKQDARIFIPTMHPMHHSIGLRKTNFYKSEHFYRK